MNQNNFMNAEKDTLNNVNTQLITTQYAKKISELNYR